MLGYQSGQEKILPFVPEKMKNKNMKEPLGKVREKWILECKRGQKRYLENSAWFADREENVGNWLKKNLINQIRMIKSKGWVTNMELETIKRKLENEGRDEVN